MRSSPASIVLSGLLLGACASTQVRLDPAPQAPVCDRAADATVFWAPRWRADQKDVAERERMADEGLRRFFASSGCFRSAELVRVAALSPAVLAPAIAADGGGVAMRRRVTIEVRELGPVLRLLSSVALIEGGTEVVLQVGDALDAAGTPARRFEVRRTHGGPGVIRGVGGLSADLEATLAAALQPRP